MSDYDLPFKAVRTTTKWFARRNLIIGWAAYETALRLYENDRVDHYDGACTIATSESATSGAGRRGAVSCRVGCYL
jgi:hypothetical protein